jgi:transketolase
MASVMRQRFVDVTSEILDSHHNVALVTADLTASLFESARQNHPDRVLNVGIREQLMIGVTGGLSLAGMRPIAHSFAPFLIERPFEQIKLDLNHQRVGAILVSAGASYDMANAGRTHQSPGDVALVSTLPDWVIHVPGHADEAEQQLRRAATGDGLVYIRLSNQSNVEAFGLRSGEGFNVLREGKDGIVIAVGPLADSVLSATEHLDVTILYTATVRPFDADGLRAAVGSHVTTSVVLVEPYLAGTSSSEVSAALVNLPHRILALGVSKEELRNYGSPRQHAIAHGLGPAGLRKSITSFLST